MGKLIIDRALQAQLADLNELTMLTDEAGQPLGQFLPKPHDEPVGPEAYRLAEQQCPYSANQLDQMRRESGGKSLADFWQTIGAK